MRNTFGGVCVLNDTYSSYSPLVATDSLDATCAIPPLAVWPVVFGLRSRPQLPFLAAARIAHARAVGPGDSP